LDQMARYLDHLNQLRRTNDGDDTADAPGYGLHLVRIPVSVFPGKKTRQGYGAEVTLSIEPYLSEDLLPATYRNLVINDVIDQLALGITKGLEAAKNVDELQHLLELLDEVRHSWKDQSGRTDSTAPRSDSAPSTDRRQPTVQKLVEEYAASGRTPLNPKMEREVISQIPEFKPLDDIYKRLEQAAPPLSLVRNRRSRQPLS